MDPSDVSSYKTLFIKTAREFLDQARPQLEVLSTNPQDKNALETLIRGAHSIKGQSRMMQYLKTGDLAERVEKRLRAASEGTAPVTPQVAQAVAEGFSTLRNSIDMIEKEDKEADVSETMKKLEQI